MTDWMRSNRTRRVAMIGSVVAMAGATAFACGEAPDRSTDEIALQSVAAASGGEAEQPGRSAASLATYDRAAASPDASNVGGLPGRRMIIREVSVELEVADVFAARDRLAGLATESGGFLSAVGVSHQADSRRGGRITLRVPAAAIETVVDAIGDLGEVRSESQGTHDITREYLDTEARLRVLRETDARLRGILAGRTGNLADVLQVERELSRVVTEIEQLEGQRRFWEEQVSLAAVHVTLAEPLPAVEAGWADPVIAAFRGSLGMLARSAAVLITVMAGALPFVALALVGWIVFVLVRRMPAA